MRSLPVRPQLARNFRRLKASLSPQKSSELTFQPKPTEGKKARRKFAPKRELASTRPLMVSR